MPQTSGKLQNFISDEIQIWAHFGLKMLTAGRKAPKWPKVAQKRCRYLQIPYFCVFHWFTCILIPSLVIWAALRDQKGSILVDITAVWLVSLLPPKPTETKFLSCQQPSFVLFLDPYPGQVVSFCTFQVYHPSHLPAHPHLHLLLLEIAMLREMKNMVKNENVPLTPYSEALCMLT